jgi:hypothetical protein
MFRFFVQYSNEEIVCAVVFACSDVAYVRISCYDASFCIQQNGRHRFDVGGILRWSSGWACGDA